MKRIKSLKSLWPLATLCVVSLLLLQPLKPARADFAVQVGAFADHGRAIRRAEQLQRQEFSEPAYLVENESGSLTLVLVGNYSDYASARDVRNRLAEMGLDGFITNTSVAHPDSLNTDTTQAPAPDIQARDINSLVTSVPAARPALLVAQQDTAGEPQSLDELFGDTTETSDDLFGETTTSRNTRYSGFFQSEYAYTVPSPDHSSKFRNILELRATGHLQDNLSWKISGRGAYDAIFDLDNFYSGRVRDDRQFDGMLHETYLDISAGDFDFRLGRQHIIWGEMVGLFFADVVSAKDMRQFVAQDFDLIRLPQWALRAEHFKGDFHTEVIWIPYMTYDEIGEPGDDFYPLSTTPLPGFDLIIANDKQPAQKLSNGSYGMRVSVLKSGWDISSFYYRSVDAAPAFSRAIVMAPTPSLVFTPEHDKIHQFGLTLAKDFGDFLLKGEAILTKDRWFNVDDISDLDGLVQQDILDYVVGLEHTTINGTVLNFQFFQRWYTDHDSEILFDELESGLSFYGSRELGRKAEAELLLISGLNRSDWMARPKITWTLDNNWELAAGVDIFGGKSVSLFGRFDDSDRVYGLARYSF